MLYDIKQTQTTFKKENNVRKRIVNALFVVCLGLLVASVVFPALWSQIPGVLAVCVMVAITIFQGLTTNAVDRWRRNRQMKLSARYYKRLEALHETASG